MEHISVLLEESTELLLGNGGRFYVDCTVGGGGHTKRILEKNPDAFVIGIDQDEEALNFAEEKLKDFEGRFSLYQANFVDLDTVLREEGVPRVDGFLFDLGMSMYQLRGERGFSFQENSPLDMRMDRRNGRTAYQVVNEYSLEKLIDVFKRFGEERFSGRIAKAIVSYRRKKPIETSKELADLVAESVPPAYRYGRIHPATKVFQAIRIEVNRELEILEEALRKTLNYLGKGGRLVVISFHSLEDRIVKRFMKENQEVLRILTKKPIVPSDSEVNFNPAARSAKLRAGECIG